MSHGPPSRRYMLAQPSSQNRENSIPKTSANEEQGHRDSNRSSYTQHTITILQSQIRKKIPTLILKLKEEASFNHNNVKSRGHHKHQNLSDLLDHELEEYLTLNLQELKHELMDNIDNFHKIILSAKPNPAKQREDPQGYKIHLQQYHEFLQLANKIMKHMQDSFNDILTLFREHIDQLWIAICQDEDVRSVQYQFEQHLQQNMIRYWKPIFDRADQLIAEIDANFNQRSTHPMPIYESSH